MDDFFIEVVGIIKLSCTLWAELILNLLLNCNSSHRKIGDFKQAHNLGATSTNHWVVVM